MQGRTEGESSTKLSRCKNFRVSCQVLEKELSDDGENINNNCWCVI